MFSAFFATYAVLTDAPPAARAGGDLFELPQRRHRDRLPAALELHLRPRRYRRRGAASVLFYGAMAATFVLGAAFLALELHEFAGLIGPGRRPDAQRLPLGLLRADRLPRPARHRRPALAADDDGAGLRQGLPAGHPAPHCSASASSGTPSTSSGWRCSASSTWWEWRDERARAARRTSTRRDIAPGDEHLDGQRAGRGHPRLPHRPRAGDAADRRLLLHRAAPPWSGSRASRSRSRCWPSRRWASTWSSSCTSPPGPDNVNNVLALAFGVLIVMLLVFGSLWIMTHLNHNMMPMDQIMQMQR